MRIPRIFTQQALAADSEIALEPAACRHLTQVLRLRKGDGLILFNGIGLDYPAVLLNAGKRHCRVVVHPPGPMEPPQPLNIELAIGISKGERMDFALQKAAELGVSRLIPLITEHCVVRLSQERLEKRMQHWRGVVIGACEQSGRRRIPENLPAGNLTDWLSDKADQGLCLVLDHRADNTLASLRPPTQGQTVSLLIGPEGGLSENEMELARKSGFNAVRLGPRILRTETAPLAAIAAIQMLWGDFR